MLNKVNISCNWFEIVFDSLFELKVGENSKKLLYRLDRTKSNSDIRSITANVTFILDDNLKTDSIREILEGQESVLNILYRCSRFPPFFTQLPIKTKMTFFNSWLTPDTSATQLKYAGLPDSQE